MKWYIGMCGMVAHVILVGAMYPSGMSNIGDLGISFAQEGQEHSAMCSDPESCRNSWKFTPGPSAKIVQDLATPMQKVARFMYAHSNAVREYMDEGNFYDTSLVPNTNNGCFTLPTTGASLASAINKSARRVGRSAVLFANLSYDMYRSDPRKSDGVAVHITSNRAELPRRNGCEVRLYGVRGFHFVPLAYACATINPREPGCERGGSKQQVYIDWLTVEVSRKGAGRLGAMLIEAFGKQMIVAEAKVRKQEVPQDIEACIDTIRDPGVIAFWQHNKYARVKNDNWRTMIKRLE